MEIRFRVHTEPKAKARPRSRVVTPRRGRAFSQTYTDPKSRREEELFRAAIRTFRPSSPITSAVRLAIEFGFPYRAGWTKAQQRDADDGRMNHLSRPDLDNLAKLVLDAMNPHPGDEIDPGGWWLDDGQVVELNTRKVYSRSPYVLVSVVY